MALMERLVKLLVLWVLSLENTAHAIINDKCHVVTKKDWKFLMNLVIDRD